MDLELAEIALIEQKLRVGREYGFMPHEPRSLLELQLDLAAENYWDWDAERDRAVEGWLRAFND